MNKADQPTSVHSVVLPPVSLEDRALALYPVVPPPDQVKGHGKRLRVRCPERFKSLAFETNEAQGSFLDRQQSGGATWRRYTR